MGRTVEQTRDIIAEVLSELIFRGTTARDIFINSPIVDFIMARHITRMHQWLRDVPRSHFKVGDATQDAIRRNPELLSLICLAGIVCVDEYTHPTKQCKDE